MHLAEVIKRAPTMDKDQIIIMNLCGRGDKDVHTVSEALGSGDLIMTQRMTDRFAKACGMKTVLLL